MITPAHKKPPPAALKAGYTLQTFDSAFLPATVDTQATYAPGFAWYLNNFYGYPPMAPSGYKFKPDGGIVLTGLTGYQNGGGLNQLATAGSQGWQKPWVGTAFGGGFYAEATFSFDAANVNPAHGWPSFWGSPIEIMNAMEADVQWQGQVPGYNQFIELDFFEYWPQKLPNEYISTMHDWYGLLNVTCNGYCDVNTGQNGSNLRTAPASIDWSEPHVIGYLWVPATATTDGYTQSYLDGVPIGPQQSWSQFTNQPPPPGNGAPWTYGITDQQHMVIILDTGTNQDLTVKSVEVWQASAAGNWVQ